jgi:hypothetical protein
MPLKQNNTQVQTEYYPTIFQKNNYKKFISVIFKHYLELIQIIINFVNVFVCLDD